MNKEVCKKCWEVKGWEWDDIADWYWNDGVAICVVYQEYGSHENAIAPPPKRCLRRFEHMIMEQKDVE